MTLVLRVAGVTYRQREALGVAYMAAECPPELRLVPEPNNAADRHAVRVEGFAAGAWHHVGYIPRKQAPMVGAHLAAGRVKSVALAGHGTISADDSVPWLRIKVEVQL